MNTAIVDLRRIKENYALLSERKNVWCVVKCDAYGHGLTETATALYDAGARRFCVASGEEATTLLRIFSDADILLLGVPDRPFCPSLCDAGVLFSLSDYESAARLSDCAMRTGKTARAHIACDSGMNRMGFSLCPRDREKTIEIITKIAALPYLRVTGVYTHFAAPAGNALYDLQISRFRSALSDILPLFPDAEVHFAATPTVGEVSALRFPGHEVSCRVGLGLYGYGVPGVLPAMSIRTQICKTAVMRKGEHAGYGGDFTAPCDMPVAVAGIGYGDGLPRLAENAYFRFGFYRLPVVGRISMNLTVLSTGDAPVSTGDCVTVIGRDGEETDAFCRASGKIVYELLLMGSRIRRIYQ